MSDESLSDYLADNYGTCERSSECLCIRPGYSWLGRRCSSWHPTSATNLTELREEQLKFRKVSP